MPGALSVQLRHLGFWGEVRPAEVPCPGSRVLAFRVSGLGSRSLGV